MTSKFVSSSFEIRDEGKKFYFLFSSYILSLLSTIIDFTFGKVT